VNNSFLRGLVVVLLCVLIALAFLVPLPGRTLLAIAIQNALHTLAFAVFAFALNWYIERPIRTARLESSKPLISTVLLCSTLILFALAIFSELVQPSTGRSYSTYDILRDFLGIAIGHIGYLLFRYSPTFIASRFTLVFSLLVLVLVGLGQPLWFWYLSTTKPAWPMLADFEHSRSLAYIKTDDRSPSVAREAAPTDWQSNQSTVIRIDKDSSSYSGFSLFDFESDWRFLTHFEFDVFNPQDQTVELILRINDTHHNNQYHDRFNHIFQVAPGSNAMSIAIDDMLTLGSPRNDGRIMDISSISGLVFFMTLGSAGKTLYLDNIRVR